MNKLTGLAISAIFILINSQSASAGCQDVTRNNFEAAVKTGVSETNAFGFGLPMWVSMVDESGRICHVFATDGTHEISGYNAGNSAWLGSRIISAQKAFTANAFSLDGLAISTGFVYATVVPNGSLYGLQHSNPVDASRAYRGNPASYGTVSDPIRFERIGGINVFGGGVALYKNGVKIGAIGASGDTSCRDHTVAYRTRIALGLNDQPTDDGLALVTTPTALGQQPKCGVNDPPASVANNSTTDFGIR